MVKNVIWLKKLKIMYFFLLILRQHILLILWFNLLNLQRNHGLHWIQQLFFLKNYFLLNDMIIKIDTRKIKHQSNTEIFIWNCNNLIESKLKQIVKTNLKSTKCWRIKLKKKKDSIEKKIARWFFLKKKKGKKESDLASQLKISRPNSLFSLSLKLTNLKVTPTWFSQLCESKNNR